MASPYPGSRSWSRIPLSAASGVRHARRPSSPLMALGWQWLAVPPSPFMVGCPCGAGLGHCGYLLPWMTFFAGTGAAARRKSTAMLDSQPAMNATGKRRQIELLGNSVASAVRCSSSRRSVCQSKRRDCAVTAARGCFGAMPARSAWRAKRRPKFLHGFFNFQAAFLPGLREACCGLPGASKERPAATISPRSIAFLALSQDRMTFLQSLRICRKRVAAGWKEGHRS